MSKRVVLYGATGYTGQLTLDSMVGRGIKPMIVGRNVEKLEMLSEQHDGLEFAFTSSDEPDSLVNVLEAGDVLVSTVGPFARHGDSALEAALQCNTHYMDSTGEPAFIRKVFEEYTGKVRGSGKTWLTAFGYDYVPGNTVAAWVLEKAGEKAASVDVGYFVTGDGGLGMSQGTFASLLGAVFDPGIVYQDGRYQEKFGGTATCSFHVAGKQKSGLMIPGSEAFGLPPDHPALVDVNVYLGWFEGATMLMKYLSLGQSLLFRLPGIRRGLKSLSGMKTSHGQGPDEEDRKKTGSCVVAVARDSKGVALAEATLEGVNPYTYTANILAWGSEKLLQGNYRQDGVVGPSQAFSLEELVEGNRQSGLLLEQGSRGIV